MKRAELVLIVATGIILVAVVAFCWYVANSPQSYNNNGPEPVVPWPLVWAQIASTASTILALVGLASAAGLLFLKAARWRPDPMAVADPTPEPSP